MCRKRPFATHGQEHLPARVAVCRIPCLILCLADVWRVCQCRASLASPSGFVLLRRTVTSTPSPAVAPTEAPARRALS